MLQWNSKYSAVLVISSLVAIAAFLAELPVGAHQPVHVTPHSER